MDLYELHDKVKNGYIYCESVRGMYVLKYRLPQARILANNLLKEILCSSTQLINTKYRTLQDSSHIKQGLFWSRSLSIDDFGIKRISREHAEHLMSVLKQHYKMKEDWKGKGKYIAALPSNGSTKKCM